MKPSSASVAASSAGGVRCVSTRVSAKTPPIVAPPATVDMNRQPSGVSPKISMPAAISSLPSSGCSTFSGPDSVSSTRAART